eukprot:5562702-Prorocentrum_lima.AAC.1
MLCYRDGAEPSALSEQTPSNGFCCFHAFNQILNRSLALLRDKGNEMPPIKENFRTFDVGVKVIVDDLVKSMDGIQNVVTKFGGDGVMLEKLQLEI